MRIGFSLSLLMVGATVALLPSSVLAVDSSNSRPPRQTFQVPCSMGKPTHDKTCAVTVDYGDPGNSMLTITRPDGRHSQRILNYYDNDLHSPVAGDNLSVGIADGQYYIGINDNEYYIIEEMVITGID
jgi:hypothetical protein